MKGSNMRDKARATFGKTFFENTKEPAPAKNGAVALQKRANARPIPTYKVGGVVKKADGGRPVSTGSPTMRSTGSPTMQSTGSPTAMRSTGSPTVMRSTGSPTAMRSTGSPVSTAMPVSTKSPTGATPPGMSSKLVKKKAVGGVAKKQNGGALTPAEKARAQAMIKQRGDAAMRDPLVMRYLDAQNRAPMSVPGVGPKAATKRAEGGGIEAQRLEARADAGRYKHGGKIKKKAIGGVMEEYDTMPSSVRQAGYQQAAPAYGEYGAGPKPMQQMVANPNPIAPAYKKGGKIVKKAVGGAMGVSARSTRNRAQSGYDNYMNQMRMGVSTGNYDPTPYGDPAWQKANKIRVGKPLASAPASTPTRRPLPTPGVMVGSGMVAQPAPAPGYKKGGKAKSGLAVMIAIGKPMKGMKKPVKRAVGGAGKTRKGQMKGC